MGLLLITGSLEPGRDGVGDYARRLAAECQRQGEACFLLALNDSHLDAPVEQEETLEGHSVPILRLPATLSWPQRMQRARAFRSRLPVTRISLQFVPYAFAPRGIVRGLEDLLAPLIAGVPLHLMLHEIWIGLLQTAPFKERMVGLLQRRYLIHMIRRLQPRWISTSNVFYHELLQKLGLTTSVLPLFGNIPLPASGTTPPLPLSAQKFLSPETPRLTGLFFGALHPEWPFEPFCTVLRNAAERRNARPSLIAAGRLATAGEAHWHHLQQSQAGKIDFLTLGELPAENISALMLAADLGVAASPWPLLGKSGSATAMLEHGLPVVVARTDFPRGTSETDLLLYACDAPLEDKLAAGLPRRAPHERLPDIARAFLELLR